MTKAAARQQRMVSVDVGSGFTQFTDGATEGSFPSLVCVAPSEMGFGSEGAEIVNVDGANYLIGKSAKAFGDPADRADTLHDDWAGSTAWKAALYGSLARLGVKSGENIHVVTGLPQALYSRKKDELIRIVGGEKEFLVNNEPFKINIDLKVIPQASGAIFYQATKEETVLQDSVGVIDIGTYTTGFSVIEEGMPIAYRCGGCSVGVSQLAKALQASLVTELNLKLDIAKMATLLVEKEVRYRGTPVDLTDMIARQALLVARPLLEKVSKLWDGGGELTIYIAGGGAEYFADAIKTVLPHATVMPDSFYAVVRGMHAWLTIVNQGE
jgi:PRTRC genetic system protein D